MRLFPANEQFAEEKLWGTLNQMDSQSLSIIRVLYGISRFIKEFGSYSTIQEMLMAMNTGRFLSGLEIWPYRSDGTVLKSL
jgi:hypothetical protein